jgi:hypothetical protein
MLDWDSTSIVFTKRSLIEFLKGVSIREIEKFVPKTPPFTGIQESL